MLNRKLDSFFMETGISCQTLDLPQEVTKFKQAMSDGYQGNSSLKMIPTYINFQEKIAENSAAIVIDAGGTNLRIALVELRENNHAEITYLKKNPMIGLAEAVTVTEFFEQLVSYLEPIIQKTNKIGFCFSFPTTITPDRDGEVIEMNKGVTINGIAGVKLGEHLKEALQQHGFGINYDVSVVNDTVACLLGGMIIDPMKQYDTFIGFILGTGTNTAFVEPTQSMIINIESGGYVGIPQHTIDLAMDMATDNCGKQTFEKMISGAYLGTLAKLLLQKASQAHFFTEKFGQTVMNLTHVSTEDLSLFMDYPYSNYNQIGKLINTDGSDDDRVLVFAIIDQLLTRSAKLVVINLIGIMDYLELGQQPSLPICISSEGSTFFKFKRLNQKILQEVNQYSKQEAKYFCEFVEARESTLYGTAIAALVE